MNQSKLRIPKEFKLFGTTVKVVFDNNRMNQGNKYGEADYSTQQITLSTTIGVKPLSEDRIMDCYYHEKVHMILEAMKETDLSENEKFVDIFAKLWRQADESSVYGSLTIDDDLKEFHKKLRGDMV